MRIVAIINSKAKSGDSKNLESVLREKFSDSYMIIERTTSLQEAKAVAQLAVGDGVDTVIAVGGDGTINGIINGIVGSNVALGIIPRGTANDLALKCSIPEDIDQACQVIHERNVRSIDLISVNGCCYARNGGIGLPCKVAAVANDLKRNGKVSRPLIRFLGGKLYILAALMVIARNPHSRIRITINDENCLSTLNAAFMMINNQSILAKNFVMSPRAINDDGLFDVCLVEHVNNPLKLFRLLIQAFQGTHVALPFVRTWGTKKLLVKTEEPLSFLADGEIFEKSTEYTIELLPRALNVIVPLQDNGTAT